MHPKVTQQQANRQLLIAGSASISQGQQQQLGTIGTMNYQTAVRPTTQHHCSKYASPKFHQQFDNKQKTSSSKELPQRSRRQTKQKCTPTARSTAIQIGIQNAHPTSAPKPTGTARGMEHSEDQLSLAPITKHQHTV
ncbi:hypothetical protein Nepgr_009384 [Nepenthes gracilis]|uniref:Uncharacterized protein n=1 Tax=Nepenthes gracilis TaxID=150966 RepID=A0AAD3XKA5_NEPGR|nr:hypothetical protein Nepgr_009384 [Nepenthes gracilis]